MKTKELPPTIEEVSAEYKKAQLEMIKALIRVSNGSLKLGSKEFLTIENGEVTYNKIYYSDLVCKERKVKMRFSRTSKYTNIEMSRIILRCLNQKH